MKRLAGIVLKIVALGIPMVIAACYGVPANYLNSRRGKVVDATTHDLLGDIKVSCLDSAGAATDSYITTASDGGLSNGDWVLSFNNDAPCAKLEAADTLTPARYQTTKVDFPSTDDSSITMTAVK